MSLWDEPLPLAVYTSIPTSYLYIYVVLVAARQTSASRTTDFVFQPLPTPETQERENKKMHETLSLFVASEKPDWLTAPDFAVLVCLMAATTPEQPKTWLARETIGKRVGLGHTAVSGALDTLHAEGYIHKTSGKRVYNSNLYEVLYENLPMTQATMTAVSAEAKALAVIYRDLFLRYCMKYVNKSGRQCRRKLRHDWNKRWSAVIQKLLDAGNTPNYITIQFNWFCANKPKQFRAGPQGLIALWPKEAK
jgi:hypothetical protein